MELSFQIDSKRFTKSLFLFLLSLELLFVLLDIVFNYFGLIPNGSIQRLFNIAREDSLQAWVAGVQTVCVGLVVWLIFAKTRGRAWAAIAAFFTYLGVDDGAKIHERIGTAVKDFSSARVPASEALLETSYTWQFVFGPFFISMGLFILWFMWRELREPVLRWLIFAALACYGLAVGIDFVEGMPGAYAALGEYLGLTTKFTSHFGRVIEEFLELLGSSLFLVTFLKHFMQISPRTSVVFRDEPPAL